MHRGKLDVRGRRRSSGIDLSKRLPPGRGVAGAVQKSCVITLLVMLL
jgi:hypothetical protein